jgi:hypothetical protein
MRGMLAALVVLGTASGAAAEPRMPWYRGFYNRFGIRDTYGVQEPFHAWAAVAFGLGYRFDRDVWGIDTSVLDVQYDPEEGMHTAVRIVPYIGFHRWTCVDFWAGAGLSFGWVKGTVDQAIPKRRGDGFQAEAQLGLELPRTLYVRTFVQLTLTVPLYHLRDNYRSLDSTLDVYALEASVGIRY